MKREFFWNRFPDEIKSSIKAVIFHIPGRIKVNKLLKQRSDIRVEFGSGKREGMNGWVSADLCDASADLRIDVSGKLPFPDNSITAIYSSHLLEHMNIRQIRRFLMESSRILKPGGRFSVAVPDAAIYIGAYCKSADLDPFYLRQDLTDNTGLTYRSRIDYINHIAYMGKAHRHMFDEKALLAVLEESGFREVRPRGFIPGLDIESRRTESIYAEAVK